MRYTNFVIIIIIIIIITIAIACWLQVRMAALGVLSVLFDGTKQFLMVAEDRLVVFARNGTDMYTVSWFIFLFLLFC